MNRELVQFAQRLGYSEVIFRCDNERAILQLQRLAVKTRQNMVLKTPMSTSVAYDNGNSLAENAIAWPNNLQLASCTSFMEGLVFSCQVVQRCGFGRYAMQLGWSAGYQCYVEPGLSSWHLVEGLLKICVWVWWTCVRLCASRWQQSGCKVASSFVSWKGWHTHNSYVLFDGESIILAKSIRRISTTWQGHMAYYLHCKCNSWQFKSGFGAGILPTMKKMVPQCVGFEVPLGPIEDNKLHDAEVETVITFILQKTRRKLRKTIAMTMNDPIRNRAQLDQQQSSQPTVFDDGAQGEPVVVHVRVPVAPQAGESSSAMAIDPGLKVPVTPPWESKRFFDFEGVRWRRRWGCWIQKSACGRSKETTVTTYQHIAFGVWAENQCCENCIQRILHHGWLQYRAECGISCWRRSMGWRRWCEIWFRCSRSASVQIWQQTERQRSHQMLGWMSLQTRWKLRDCAAWEFSLLRNLQVQSVGNSPPSLSEIGA